MMGRADNAISAQLPPLRAPAEGFNLRLTATSAALPAVGVVFSEALFMALSKSGELNVIFFRPKA